MKYLLAFGVLLLAILFFAGVTVTWLATNRPDLSKYENLYAPSARAAVTSQFFGTSSMLFSDGETNLMIDGWFTRPSMAEIILGEVAPDEAAIDGGLARLGNPEVAALIVAHSHLDHAMDAAEVAKRTGALVVGSESTANIARGGGLPESQIRVVEDGETLEFGSFSVTLIESRHFAFPKGPASPLVGSDNVVSIDEPLVPPASAYAYRAGVVYSVLIAHPSGTALVQSSAGFNEGSLHSLDVDTVYLGVGFLASQSPDYQDAYWREVVTATQPEGLYLIHWDSFSTPLADTASRPAAPSHLWNHLLGMRVEAGIDFARQRAADAGITLALPPMWSKVDAFSVRPTP